MTEPLPLATYLDERYATGRWEAGLYEGLSGVVMRASHRLMERGIKPHHNRAILEIGGGGMPHSYWIDLSQTEQYTVSDILRIHPQRLAKLREDLPNAIALHLHDFESDRDMNKLEGGYSRVIASHVLEHIPTAEQALRKWISLLAEDGVLSIALPCDPGWLWRLGQKVSYNPRQMGLTFEEYDLIMAREHVTSVQRVLKFMRYYFKAIKVHWYPAIIPVADFNLFCMITARKSDLRNTPPN